SAWGCAALVARSVTVVASESARRGECAMPKSIRLMPTAHRPPDAIVIVPLSAAGPDLVLLPANGFPPATYLPALAPLLDRSRVSGLPPRALRPDAGPAPERPGSWESLATDA